MDLIKKPNKKLAKYKIYERIMLSVNRNEKFLKYE